MKCIVFFVISFLVCSNLYHPAVEAARVLAVFPFPSVSHYRVFDVLISRLLQDGHEVVMVTTSSKYNGTIPENLRVIDICSSYEVLADSMKSLKARRGIVLLPVDDIIVDGFKTLARLVFHTMNNEEFKKTLQDENQHFDLVITESLFFSPLILAQKYNAPLIWFSSFYGVENSFQAIGAPIHPILYPSCYMDHLYNIDFWSRTALFTNYKLWQGFSLLESLEIDYIQNNFKDAPADIFGLTKNIDLMYVNIHPLFQSNRPVPPNVINLSSLHLQPATQLPEDLKSYMDASKNGVIYVSLGTLVVPSMMDADMLDSFLDAFERLPYNVLWKYQNATFTRNVSNLRVMNWFPQRDLLTHPNIKAFITQGGIQSTDEAIDAEVPLVGIPMLGDQGHTVAKYVQLGIGVKLDPMTMTAADIVSGVMTVIEDESYRQNIKKIKWQIWDQPQTSLERIIWWTNFVLRHRDAKFLSSPSANITFKEYLQIDVLLTSAAILIICITVIFLTLRNVFRFIRTIMNYGKKKEN